MIIININQHTNTRISNCKDNIAVVTNYQWLIICDYELSITEEVTLTIYFAKIYIVNYYKTSHNFINESNLNFKSLTGRI